MLSSRERVPGLDVLRSAAILGVIATHLIAYHGEKTLPRIVVPLAKQGWIGVDLFFVLSGYLIGSQLFRILAKGEKVHVWSFYRRRFYRVLPAFLVVLAAYFLLPHGSSAPLAPLWQYITFTYNLTLDSSRNTVFSHVWSLCVEEHFYLLMPLIVIGLTYKPSFKKTASLLFAIFVFGVAVRGFVLVHSLLPLAGQKDHYAMAYLAFLYHPTYCRLDGLLAGVALALVQIFRPEWWARIGLHGHALTICGLLFIVPATWLLAYRLNPASAISTTGTLIGYPMLAAGFLFLTASAISENGWLNGIKIPGARLCATLAYSLYLIHKALIPVVDVLFPRLAQANSTAWLLVYLVLTFSAAGALYLGVERPFLRLRDYQFTGVKGSFLTIKALFLSAD